MVQYLFYKDEVSLVQTFKTRCSSPNVFLRNVELLFTTKYAKRVKSPMGNRVLCFSFFDNASENACNTSWQEERSLFDSTFCRWERSQVKRRLSRKTLNKRNPGHSASASLLLSRPSARNGKSISSSLSLFHFSLPAALSLSRFFTLQLARTKAEEGRHRLFLL